jgi:hypothetical protein
VQTTPVDSDGGLSGDVFALSLDSIAMDAEGRVVQSDDPRMATSRHVTFFAVVQAACYILCFYGVDLAALQKSDESLRRAWCLVLGSDLDPLRYCIKSVKWEFVKLATWTGLVDEQCLQGLLAFALRRSRSGSANSRHSSVDIEQCVADEVSPIHSGSSLPLQKRARSGSMVSDASHLGREKERERERWTMRRESADFNCLVGADNFNPLYSFFPFDPCLLKMVHGEVAPGYRSWDGVPGMDRAWTPQPTPSAGDEKDGGTEEEDGDEDGEDEEGDEVEEEEGDEDSSLEPIIRKESYGEEKGCSDGVWKGRESKEGSKTVSFTEVSAIPKTFLVSSQYGREGEQWSGFEGGDVFQALEMPMEPLAESGSRKEAAKRSSPVMTSAMESTPRRRRYSITNALDW